MPERRRPSWPRNLFAVHDDVGREGDVGDDAGHAGDRLDLRHQVRGDPDALDDGAADGLLVVAAAAGLADVLVGGDDDVGAGEPFGRDGTADAALEE